jgi:formate dehydrogenase iron-sulfur subunit
MNVSRRSFLKLAGAAAGATALAEWPAPATAATPTAAIDDAVGVLVDTTMCIGCRSCEAACSEANHLPEPVMFGDEAVFAKPRTTSASTYTVVNRYANPRDKATPRFVKTQCLHCLQPACASACPANALQKTAEGAVTYRADRCLGCRYCMVACPFDVPKFQYERAVPTVQKCSFCFSRQQQGKVPACVEACPAGTLTFGKRRELLETARTRIYQKPDQYVHEVYGEREAGGTSWLYISDVPFDKLGLRTHVGTTAYPELTRNALSVVPLILTMAPPFLMGLYEFSRRPRETGSAPQARDAQETQHD